jgi:hypothetical protein
MPDTMKRRPNGLPALATKALESIGLLNKGSAALSQAPSSPSEPGAAAPETGEPPPVVDPALNVTRVGGTTALITGAGGAFLTLTNLTDQTPDAVRVAAYAGTAVVVAAALIATAIMIVADIRARSALAVARLTAPAAPTSGTTSDDPPPSFRAAWAQVLERLQNVKDQTPTAVGRPDLTRLWLEAEATKGLSASLEPPPDLSDEHQFLRTGQDEVCELLGRLRSNPQAAAERDDLRLVVDQLQAVLNNVPGTA